MKTCFKIFLTLFLVVSTCAFAAKSSGKNKKYPTFESHLTADEYYSFMIEAYDEGAWRELLTVTKILSRRYSLSPYAQDAYYYMALAYYQLGDFEPANNSFSTYLSNDLPPKYFDQAIKFKFDIAKKFEEGARRHVFKSRKFPKWLSAKELSLEIYEEVIATLPRDPLAAESLFRKANLLASFTEYQKSIDAYQTLIRRFPKHPRSSEAYVEISKVYLIRCKKEFRDSDILDLSEINFARFKSHFPTDPKVDEVRGIIFEIKEEMAKDLLEAADFYERTKRTNAAILYYSSIVSRYPETETAAKSRVKLKKLSPEVEATSEKLLVEASSNQVEKSMKENTAETPTEVSSEKK